MSFDRYVAVNSCIYCGSTDDLTDEHIVPFALNGLSVLPKSSCKSCSAITSAFEGRCARIMYGNFRIINNVQTRRRKERPKTIKALLQGSQNEPIDIPIENCVGTLPWVHFLPAGIFRKPPIKEDHWAGSRLEVHSFMPRDPSPMRDVDFGQVSFVQRFDVDSLALTLARVAHALAVANFGVDFFEPWLPPYILGRDKSLSYLIGGGNVDKSPEDILHNLGYQVGPRTLGWGVTQTLLTVDIRFWAQFGGPSAEVVVGKTTPKKVADYLRSSTSMKIAN